MKPQGPKYYGGERRPGMNRRVWRISHIGFTKAVEKWLRRIRSPLLEFYHTVEFYKKRR